MDEAEIFRLGVKAPCLHKALVEIATLSSFAKRSRQVTTVGQTETHNAVLRLDQSGESSKVGC